MNNGADGVDAATGGPEGPSRFDLVSLVEHLPVDPDDGFDPRRYVPSSVPESVPESVPTGALAGLPHLPYGGTSGAAPADTSRERAADNDRSGRTAEMQARAIRLLQAAGQTGVTVAELRQRSFFEHHGTASGVLSVLHKAGVIARLAQRRDRCKIYVMPELVEGRATERHGRRSTAQTVVRIVRVEVPAAEVPAADVIAARDPAQGSLSATCSCGEAVGLAPLVHGDVSWRRGSDGHLVGCLNSHDWTLDVRSA